MDRVEVGLVAKGARFFAVWFHNTTRAESIPTCLAFLRIFDDELALFTENFFAAN